MQHQAHISEKDESSVGTKLVAVLVVVAAVIAIGGYVVYGTGMWNPQAEMTSQ